MSSPVFRPWKAILTQAFVEWSSSKLITIDKSCFGCHQTAGKTKIIVACDNVKLVLFTLNLLNFSLTSRQQCNFFFVYF